MPTVQSSLPADDLAAVFKTLADSQRLSLLNLIIEGVHASRALSERLNLPPNLVSHHLKSLRRAGLVTVERDSTDRRWQYHVPDVRRLTEVQFLLSHFLHPARIRLRQGEYGPHDTPQPFHPPDYLSLEKEPYVNDSRMKVIFLCTGNSARSQMAEAFLRRYAGDRFEVHSAGIEPKGLNPYTLRVMQEAGLDMNGHRSKSVREYLGHVNFAYVITVCDDAEQNCPTAFLGQGTHLHWGFEDPARATGGEDQILGKFRDVRNKIENRIRAWVSEVDAP